MSADKKSPETAELMDTLFRMKRPRRVLLVEDSPDDTVITRIELESAGCIVTCVSTGPSALEAAHKARDNQYDIALIDLALPGMTGTEVALQLRYTFNLFILLYTGGNSFPIFPKPFRLQDVKDLHGALCPIWNQTEPANL